MKKILATIFFLVLFFDCQFIIAQTFPPYLPTVGLKAWYPFTGNANDSSDLAAHGTVYGTITYGTDRHGIPNACYSGIGIGGIDIPSVNLPVGNHARSTSVWYKSIIPFPGGPRMFVCWGNNTALGQRFGIFTEESGIGLEYRNGGVQTTFIQDSVWHNLIVTYPSTGGGSSAVKVYFDGVLSSSYVTAPVSSFNTIVSNVHCIGKLFQGADYTYSWEGQIDDVVIWDRALTDCEAWTIAHEGTLLDPVAIAGNSTICNGTATTLSDTMSGGTWSSSAPAIATVNSAGNVGGASIGTAIISYTRTNVCGTIVDTYTVNVVSGISVSLTGPNNLCAGNSASLILTASGTGSWSSSNPAIASVNSSGVVSGLSAGTAIISYSFTNSCGTAIDTQMITVYPIPFAGSIVGPATVCPGSTISLATSGTGGTWSSSAVSIATVGTGTGIVGGVSPGNTIIAYTVTNSCGSASDTQMITVLPMPAAGTISGPSLVCPGTTVSLLTSGSGGTWSSSATGVATVGTTTGIVVGVSIGFAIISYTVSNICGTSVDTQMISISTTPSAGTISGPSSVCAGNTVVLTDGVPGGTWSSSETGIATVNAASGTVHGVTTGTFTIYYSVTNACGSAVTTYAMTVLGPPDAGTITGGNGLCKGSTLSLSETATGGVWSSSNTSVATISSSGVVYGVAAGTTVISYTITGSCGSSSAIQTITVFPSPAVNISSASSSACIGATIILTGTPPGGVWSTATTAVATIDGSGIVHTVGIGTAVITYTTPPDDNGCTNQQTMSLNVTNTVTFTINDTITNIKCSGDHNGAISLSVSPTGSYSYTWSDGSGGTSLSGLSSGTYTVIIKDAGGCFDTATYTLAEPALIAVADTFIHADACGYNQGSINLVNVIGGVTPYHYAWSNGTAATSIEGLTSGVYSLTITDANLCAQTFAFTVPEDSCSDIVIHDVITPNGDGINDKWVIEGIHAYTHHEVYIFDKLGDIVFSSQEYNNDWNGGNAPDGTYIYLIKLNSDAVGQKDFKGTLLIKR